MSQFKMEKLIHPCVLIIAEAANPEWVSVPLVGWSLANALRTVANVHIVTQIRNRDAFVRAGLVEGHDFTAINSEKVARPLWTIASLLRGGSGKGWTTIAAFKTFSYYYFERLVWNKFINYIQSGEFDLVHRITPLSPATPSMLARKCQHANVPFVIGPLNGGVPWPKGFDSARRQEKEWLSYIRNGYKLLPGYRSTLRSSSALIIGSTDTLAQVPRKYHGKCFYIPENGIDPEKFNQVTELHENGPLRACFVGRLVPYKGVDMLIEAAAPLIRDGLLELDILGDGPMMPKLRDMVNNLKISQKVVFHGWVAHEDLQSIMCRSQLFAFPSVREFGGGVVLEAMALGLVPLVVDYAGPGDLVGPGIGYKVPIGNRSEIINSFRSLLFRLSTNPDEIRNVSLKARARVHELFTWRKKAEQVQQVYAWVLGKVSERPEPLPPQMTQE